MRDEYITGLTRFLDRVQLPRQILKEVVMSDTYTEVKAIIKDLLGADEAKITPEARFREDLEADNRLYIFICF